MPDGGAAGDRGADHPFADVRRFPERHQVGQPRPAGAFVHGLHFGTNSVRSRWMIGRSRTELPRSYWCGCRVRVAGAPCDFACWSHGPRGAVRERLFRHPDIARIRSYDMDVPAMSFQLHGWGIHAVSEHQHGSRERGGRVHGSRECDGEARTPGGLCKTLLEEVKPDCGAE